jgi:uncharacterized protein with HEPN domain
MFQLALMQLIATIGDAAGRVTTAGRARAVSIPWPELVAAGNRIVVEYDAVDLDAVWDTATREIPALAVALERVLYEY